LFLVSFNFLESKFRSPEYSTDAPIKYWPADNRHPTINRPIKAYFLSFLKLFRVGYLVSDCYPKTLTYLKDCRVQTKQKRNQKQSYKMHPMHPLLPETEATLMFVYFW